MQIDRILFLIKGYSMVIRVWFLKSELGFIADNVRLSMPQTCTCPRKIFLFDNTNIYGGAKFIISPIGEHGRFIMKKNSGAAQGLTVITGNHSTLPQIGIWHKEASRNREGDIDQDVIVEEDVWIGANVTLCSGVVVGRGSIVGAGSVVRNNIPPYAVVYGNPAKVVSFKYTPSEIIEHETVLYDASERLPLKKLERNYKKYFMDRIQEIKTFVK